MGEVKIHHIFFACDIGEDGFLLYVGGIRDGFRRCCGKIR